MKFACQESCGGKCCTFDWQGPGNSYIFLTNVDKLKLSSFLKKPLESFATLGEFSSTRFANYVTHQWFLTGNGKGCQFFKNGKCTVYEARPVQCKTFPYWPENFDNLGVIKPKVKEVCPGIDLGDDKMHLSHKFMQAMADQELRGNKP